MTLAMVKKRGDEERDSHLGMVKLLTALSYCVVGGTFFLCLLGISIRIAFNIKRCVSAEKP